MSDYIPVFVEYTDNITTVICDDNITDKVRDMRVVALRAAHKRATYFSKRGFDSKLTDAVYIKRAAFIMEATTKTQINEIMALPKPRNSGSKIVNSSTYAIAEEELMIWSETSLLAPLVHTGFDRYAELFEKVYGCSIEKLMQRQAVADA